MHNHEPQNYNCPFCRITNEAAVRGILSSDVVYVSDTVTAFLALGRWVNNPVDVLVIPNHHFENIFDLPLEYIPDLHNVARATSLAMKAIYKCDGVSTRQHNEPAGDQDVWHYHIHVTPRFADDHFYGSRKITFPEQERLDHARQLREYMAENSAKLFL